MRSPGISPYRNSIQQAVRLVRESHLASNLWFAAHPDQKTICVTGTKGKSTTSALLAHMLESCGYRVRLAGNIGLPLLACDDRDVDWWVIELSSYQLADLEAEPDISVILNLSSEHLDWHGSEQTYRDDKLRLATLAEQARDRQCSGSGAERRFVRRAMRLVQFKVRFPGEHGKLFDGDAIACSSSRGFARSAQPGQHGGGADRASCDRCRICSWTASIPLSLLPHRLQTLGERAGVRFVNDSISSTPVATVAALEAFSGQGHIDGRGA